MMIAPLPENAIGWFRRAVPFVTVVVAFLLMGIALPLPWPVMPQLGFLAVFAWAAFQPALMPPWLAFAAGLIGDLLTGLPLGCNAMLLGLTALGVRLLDQRFSGHALGFDWAIATIAATLHALLLRFALNLAGLDAALPPLLAQAALTALAYPLAAAYAARAQRRWFHL